MALDIQHWLEVLFDGVGGAALIAFVTAWKDRSREKKSAQAPKTAKRKTLWMAIAAVFFVVCLGVGVAIHVFGGTPTASEQAKPSSPLAHLSQPTVSTVENPPRRAATTADEIIALLSEQLQVDRAEIKPEKDLVLDLGATPLDKTEIVMQIETAYDIQIPDKDARKLKSVGDIINYVERRGHTEKPTASVNRTEFKDSHTTKMPRREKAARQAPIGNENTLVNVPIPKSMGSGNTFVGTTDANGKTIMNKGGTAIGKGACADPTSIAIGADAHAGKCPAAEKPTVKGTDSSPQ
jgi:acyl carrier protein